MKLPYGFYLDENEEINISRAKSETVNLIYNLYMQGNSLGGIAYELKKKQIPSPTGNNVWGRATIDKILSNKKYINTIVPIVKHFNVQFEKDRRSNMNDNNTRKTARYNSANVLSDLLVCGNCGKKFRRITRANDEVVWRCTDRVENGENAMCENLHTIADSDVKKLICKKLDIFEFNEKLVRDNIESIVI